MKLFQLSLIVVFIALLVSGCADPRTPSPTASEPAYTVTIVLWDDVVSSGEAKSATFTVDRVLDRASLTIAGFITPDSDIVRYETIRDTLVPTKEDEITDFLIQLEELGPESLWTHQDSVDAAAFQDSMDWVNDEILVLNTERDSLVRIVDNRYVFSLWLDKEAEDSTAKYPDAVYINDSTLSGQHFYFSPSDTDSVSVPGTDLITKGRSFQLNLRQWRAADPNLIGYPIEINWLSELEPSTHIIRAKLTGDNSRITGTIVLVYREGEI